MPTYIHYAHVPVCRCTCMHTYIKTFTHTCTCKNKCKYGGCTQHTDTARSVISEGISPNIKCTLTLNCQFPQVNTNWPEPQHRAINISILHSYCIQYTSWPPNPVVTLSHSSCVLNLNLPTHLRSLLSINGQNMSPVVPHTKAVLSSILCGWSNALEFTAQFI